MQAKKVLSILIFALVVITAMVSFRAFAQTSGVISFATQDLGHVFFNQATARVYVYSARNGELTTVWKVNRLGDPLEHIQ